MSKKTIAALLPVSLLPLLFALGRASALAQNRALLNGSPLPFYIYNDFRSPDNHYAPSGWMGDHRDLRYDDHFKPGQSDSKTCIKISYSPRQTEGSGWAGIYWQHPANNWGSKEGGYNLNGAKSLEFMARGEKGTETVTQFKVGGIEGNYRDSGTAAIGPLTLTKAWKKYTIPLDGLELSSIAGGFCLTLSRHDNPEGATVYLDDIRFE